MNYKHTLTTNVAKFVGSIMTIVFSLVAFAHGQSCPLLQGWIPNTLADGQSRTGYQIQEATFTQSCASAAGRITCIKGSVANGDIFKYSSCIPHTRSKCIAPTAANHLEYKTLYSATKATYTQTCQQLSQSLQCLNGIFTGGITPSLFKYTKCTDTNRKQCVDKWTNSFRDHGETVIGYAAAIPGKGQTCSTLQRTLTCTNGTWSGGNQSSLSTGCTDPGSFSGCYNIWTKTTVPHSTAVNGYTSAKSIGTGTCDDVLQVLTCTNGIRNGGTQGGLSSGCVQANARPCSEKSAGLNNGTGMLPHGSFITKYTSKFAREVDNKYCSDYAKVLQCVDSIRSGNVGTLIGKLFTGCQNVSSGSCLSAGVYTPNFQSIARYTSNTASTTQSCSALQKSYTCVNGTRSGGTPLGFTTCVGCMLTGRGFLYEGWNDYGYSITGAVFPKMCADFSTVLSCSGGIIDGNWQTYKYDSCLPIGGLVAGMDLAINESLGLPGSKNISGNLIAQGSSPEISILFKNKGDTSVVLGPIPAGFLKCIWSEQNLEVYKSNIITDFVVNSGTKVGINIRIKSLFTQALGKKTLMCAITPMGYTDQDASNNTRSGTFEVVKADRFDLALSKSIEPISKNLEAAEGAKGTQGVQNLVYNKIMNVLVPLIVIIGILSAILGFYKIMFSSEDTATKEGTRYIIYGVIGIVMIMSAKFIGQNLFDLLSATDIKGNDIAAGLYDKVIYPFIKFAIYLVLGAMFVILVSRVITFLFGSDSDAQKKAGTLIGWNIISMLIIIGAKQIVEAIYGKQAAVTKDITNLGEIGSGVLADKNIPIVYQIINYALGIASLVILVVIIIQTVKLLMKPDDPAQIKSIKNSLFYMFLGILVLGAGYLIVNFAIIN